MPDKEFLEKYPLFRKFKTQFPETLDMLSRPAIHMFCEVCNSEQTFNMMNHHSLTKEYTNYPLAGELTIAFYLCTSCRKFKRSFYLKFGEDKNFVMKVGQFPAWEISSEPNVEKMLGAHSDYFKKGLICESQGYGIGAYAYYRRIVEEIIQQLLEDITDLVPVEEKAKYLLAIEQTKKTTVTQDKIYLVKDLLPTILRPDDMNPLSVLHTILSEGLHGETDEQCIEEALTIREVLVYLVNQVIVSKSTSKSFTNSMRKILERKNK